MMTAVAQTPKVETLLPLTRQEERRLRNCEDVIEKGLNTFYDVGSALTEIRDSRLYRTTHAAFADYCQERWGMSRRRGDELIAAAAVVDNVRNERNSAQTLPANEAQANELSSLEPDEQPQVWQRVVQTAEKNGEDKPVVTAAHVKSVVKDYLREQGEEIPDDAQRKPRQKLDRTEVEALYEPEIQSRLSRYMEMITEFEDMEWPPELGYLARMFQLHKSHANFQRTRNLDGDCEQTLTVLKRLSPDVKSGFTIAAQELYDWLFDLGYCMSKREYANRMRHMSQPDVRMALLTDAGEDGKQEDRRGALPGIVCLPWRKIWKISKRVCERCDAVLESDRRGNVCNDCRSECGS
jgi:hypothetical protein